MNRRLGELQQWSRGLEDPAWQRQFFFDVIHALAEQSDTPLGAIWWLNALSLRLPVGGAFLRAMGKWCFGAKEKG